MNKSLNITSFIMVLFITATVMVNYMWAMEDNSINGVDSQNHLLYSINFFYDFSNIIFVSNETFLAKIIKVFRLIGNPVQFSSVLYWPNGLNLTAAASYLLLGKSLLSAKLAIFPYLVILLIAIYFIGKELHSRAIGLMAAFILFMYPLIFESSRQFGLDFPLTAMVTLSILFLLKCNYFKNTKYSLFLGLSLGWGMLIKGQMVLFITWPVLWVIYRAFGDSKRLNKKFSLGSKQLQNIAIFVVVAGLIGSIWWGNKILKTIAYLMGHIFCSPERLDPILEGGKKYSLGSLTWHLRRLTDSSLGIFLFIPFLFSLIAFLRRKVRFKWLYLLWLIVPFLLFSLIFTVKHPRFLMPILPVIALFTAFGLGNIRKRWVKIPFFSIIAAFSLTQFCVLSYCDWNYRNFSLGPIKIFGGTHYGAVPHYRDFKVEEVVKIINSHAHLAHPIGIGFINCGNRPSTLEMLYWLRLKNNNLRPFSLTETHEYFLRDFDSIDFILLQVPRNSSVRWPGGEKFIELFKEIHGGKLRNLYLSNKYRQQMSLLLRKLKEARSDFYLAGRVVREGREEDEDNVVYYIYKREKE